MKQPCLSSPIRLVLVEDELPLLASLSELFRQTDDIELMAAFPSAEDAVDFPWENADLLLTDLSLPGIAGAELIRRAVTNHPRLLAAAYTIHENRESLFEALQAGASGYVIKGGSADELIDAIRSLAAGQSPISPAVARHLIAEFLDKQTLAEAEDQPSLSTRELQMLQALAAGKINKEIADQFGISPHTVHNHLGNIYTKLHVRSRAEAVRLARRQGYLAENTPQ